MAANEAQKSIGRTALILTVLTAIEFLIAFTWDGAGQSLGFSAETTNTMKVLIFILLTIVKAFYIVAEFMHLGHEIRKMILSIMLPFVFIIWLIIGMFLEGSYYGRLTKEEYNAQLNNPPTMEVSPMKLSHDGIQTYG